MNVRRSSVQVPSKHSPDIFDSVDFLVLSRSHHRWQDQFLSSTASWSQNSPLQHKARVVLCTMKPELSSALWSQNFHYIIKPELSSALWSQNCPLRHEARIVHCIMKPELSTASWSQNCALDKCRLGRPYASRTNRKNTTTIKLCKDWPQCCSRISTCFAEFMLPSTSTIAPYNCKNCLPKTWRGSEHYRWDHGHFLEKNKRTFHNLYSTLFCPFPRQPESRQKKITLIRYVLTVKCNLDLQITRLARWSS